MQRKVLVPIIAAQVVVALGLGTYLVAQASGGSEPTGNGVDLNTVVVSTTSGTLSQDITATSTVAIATTAPGQQDAPAVQGTQPRNQQPVQQQADDPAPVEPEQTGVPGNTLTTTPPTTTSRVPDMPWCYNPGGKFWYSGVGEGCHEGNPDFVEYR